MPKINLKLPPQDIEAENSILGALMIDKNAVVQVADSLAPSDFYHPANQSIYKCLIRLFEKGKPIDLLTVSAQLKEEKKLKEVGGATYLTQLVNSVPTSAHVAHYANIVREKRVRRDLIRAASEINEKAFDHDDFEKLLDSVEEKIFGLSQRSRTQKFIHVKEDLPAAYERFETLHRSGEGGLRGLPTSFPQLDQLLSGLQKSDLIIVGARPSFGKTAFCLDIARKVALLGKTVGVFSLEMSREQVIDRLIASQAHVPLWRLRTGRLHDDMEFTLVQQALDALSGAALFIDDTASPTVLQIRSMARKLQIESGLDLLIVDYLQLLQPYTSTNSMVQQVTEISRGLKSLARELNIPVIAVSQLSRNVEQREIKIPKLSDLRESGCLAGDTLILCADGKRIPIDELARWNTPIEVLALDDNYKLKPCRVVNVFSSGRKQVFELKTKSGRTIRASSNHRFLCLEGWKRLDELHDGSRIALPRTLPIDNMHSSLNNDELVLHAHLLGDGCILPKQLYHYTNAFLENIESVRCAAKKLFGIDGRLVKQKNWYHLYLSSPYKLARGRRHPITEWYDNLGIKRERSYKKEISPRVFECQNNQIALFLKHLWSTDGNISWKHLKNRRPSGNVYFSTTSEKFASQVQHLLLRLNIQSTKTSVSKTGYRLSYWVIVQGAENQIRFLEKVGSADRRTYIVCALLSALRATVVNPNNDVVPREAWEFLIQPAKERVGMSWREFSTQFETAYCGSTLFKSGLSRERLMRACTVLEPRLLVCGEQEMAQRLRDIATSDVYWDTVVSLLPCNVEEVFDITVDGAHNFVANDVIVHNSLEQDADVVMFLYRKDRERTDVPEEEQNLVEIIVAKHRNGPLGSVKLHFDPENVSFRMIDTHHIQS